MTGNPFLGPIRRALGHDQGAGGDGAIAVTGEGGFASAFAVTELAAAAVGAAGAELAALVGTTPAVTVDRRLASWWFVSSIRPIGWELAPAWDAVAGDYATADGWIRLHTNAPHHRAAALGVLDVPADRAAVGDAVRTWRGETLETAVVAAGGCAAAMRDAAGWRAHPQGAAVAAEPLIAWTEAATEAAARGTWSPRLDRPLAGVRVLDLTRVLAGPVATRFLAGYGADVLRLDPPGWDEPAVAPDVTLGKRCARVDLDTRAGRQRFEALLAESDVLVHGYRSDALERLGFGDDRRRALRPGLIDVALDAYGWTGPWRTRRGFDSLVQMSAGIAHAGMVRTGGERPTPLPAQALDHATGYLAAAAALRGLGRRLTTGRGATARLSLARTAALLADGPAGDLDRALTAPGDADWSPVPEHTPWGEARRLRPALSVAGVDHRWDRPATTLGAHEPTW